MNSKKHNLQLAEAAKEAGVIKPVDYAIFQNHGYMFYMEDQGNSYQKRTQEIPPILDHKDSI